MCCIRLKCNWNQTWKVHYNFQILESNSFGTKKETLLIFFVICKEDTDNNIIGLPTIQKWGISIQLGTSMLIVPALQIRFNILYEASTLGLPCSITFNPGYLVRPGPITTPTLLTNLKQNSINTTNIPTYPPTILDENSKKYLLRTVDLNHLSPWLMASFYAPIPSLTLITQPTPPLCHITHIVSMNINKINPWIFRPKELNFYKPLDYTNYINGGFFNFLQYGNTVFKHIL